MRTDIREVDGNYELDIDLPGYKKEDMKLQLKDGYLTIQASRSEDKEEKKTAKADISAESASTDIAPEASSLDAPSARRMYMPGMRTVS